MGLGACPCEVSDRWLLFESAKPGSEFLALRVMTSTKYEAGVPTAARCLCSLVVAREDVLRALKAR